MERRRDYLKKGRGFNEFCKINGAMYSYENTYNEQTKEWHPHLHMFALLDDWIDQEELSQYWHSITGDSMIVDIRKVKKEKGLGYSKAAAEVCKYALKFGDLSVENTWQAFKVLKGKRLSGAFGSLYGVKIPENLADEMPDQKDLPYLEMLYKFVFGKHSYYDLVMTRQVEPQANIERMSDAIRLDAKNRSTAGTDEGMDISVYKISGTIRCHTGCRQSGCRRKSPRTGIFGSFISGCQRKEICGRVWTSQFLWYKRQQVYHTQVNVDSSFYYK
jgi:hypothetical protein